ncbi:hypothetical protein BVC80_1665g16 [Macleaya cordata]|uniref:Bifunctional inhibitor/plant lipid transfer protein/seed storage helical domain n=1 Tax=Macleaya cordata TaxID=56857 RepID=A0A200RBK7_MACCD|nr:hypothetical protein BVC80_1665g16 [Macleaya cordata]
MDRVVLIRKPAAIIIVAVILLILSMPNNVVVSLPPQAPICLWEFTLVSQACSLLGPIRPGFQGLPYLGHGHDEHSEAAHRRHHHRRHQTALELNCCKWLKELDSTCVCELLSRALPGFFIMLQHGFTMTVAHTCHITFKCEGRFTLKNP